MSPLVYDLRKIGKGMIVKFEQADYSDTCTIVKTNRNDGTYTVAIGDNQSEIAGYEIVAVLWDSENDRPASKERAGIGWSWKVVAKRPLNWDEMGSSARDLWEENQVRSVTR